MPSYTLDLDDTDEHEIVPAEVGRAFNVTAWEVSNGGVTPATVVLKHGGEVKWKRRLNPGLSIPIVFIDSLRGLANTAWVVATDIAGVIVCINGNDESA